MSYESILFSKEAGIARLTLNRPERLNSFNDAMHAEVRDALAQVRADTSVRVLLLTGAGRGFCAGLDLHATTSSGDGFGRGPGRRLEGQERFSSMIKTLRSLRQPVIAAVNGAAIGGGFCLALAADVRIAAEDAYFRAAGINNVDV